MKFLLSALLLTFSLTFYAQWQSTNFSGIHEGVAAFDSSTFGIVEASGVKFTSNGGGNFTEGDLLDTDGLEISGFIPTDLEYYNETTLFCTGYFITNQFEGILKSTNGGENWEYVHQATSIEPELQLNDLHVASNGDIYAVGKLGKVLKSVDDGETWTAQFVDGAGDLFQVFALDANRVSVGGVGGLFTSSNGGLIWDQEVTSDPITGISYKNSNVIMACTADDEILFTTNGGLQWSTEAFDFVNLVDVTYYSGDTWFLGSSTEVYRSDDNGASWFIQPTQLSFVPLFQLKHRNGLLIGRRQNIVIFSSDPSDIPTDYLVLNEVEAPIGACGGVQSFNLIVDNLGSNEITDLLIELHIDGELESTFEWSGSLPSQSSDQSVDLEINTGISTGEQVYEFTIIEVNNEVNNYPIESSGETNYSSAGLEGTIQIGSNGDFEDLVAFHEAVGDVSLCGDLTILLENGTYDAAYFYIDALGHDLTIEALNSIDPNVTVIGGLGFTGDSSSESHLIFRNINTTSNGLFLDPLRLQGYELIEVFNLNSSTEIEGNGDALELAADSAYVSMSSFTGGTSGIRFTGGQGTSLNIQNSNFQDHINGVFISGENDRIEINQSTFDIGNQALKINEAEYVTFSNNQCRGSNSLASMVEADTNESEGIGPRIQYFNNVIEHHHPHMLVGRGSARVLNNVFIRVGTENSFGPPIIMQNQTQADIQIKNNIFQMGNALLGNMVSSNILNQNSGIIDYNVYYSTADSPFGITNPGQFDTLEEYFAYWQSIREQDLNSVLLEVEFDPETFGKPLLNLNNASLVDISPVAGPTLDLLGNLRAIPNDIGAYELQSSILDAELVEITTQIDCEGNVDVFALVSNPSPSDITQLSISWNLDGMAQDDVEWTGLISPSENTEVLLANLFYSGIQEVTFLVTITDVNAGTEEDPENNSSDLVYTTYSGGTAFNIGEDQDFSSFDEVMTILTNEGMCGDQEIILHPGAYASQVNEISISNPQNHSLTIKSSTLEAADVDLDFNEQIWILNGIKNLHLEHVTLNSDSDTLLVVSEAMDSLIVDHCDLRGKIFLDEPFNATSLPVVYFTHNTFNGSFGNGFENSGNSGVQELIFNDNVINNNFFNTWNINCQKVEYAELKRNDINTFSFVGINLNECREAILSENQLSYRFGAAVQYTCPEEGISSLIFENNFTETAVNAGQTLLFSGASVEQSTVHFQHNTSRNGARTVQISDAQSFIYNNILTATERAIQLNTNASTAAEIDGNVYSMSNDIPAVAIGLDFYSLADWQLESGQDQNSVQQEVVFAMAEGYLTEDPIVDGLQNGVSIGGITETDIEGNNRDSNTPDAGCYEFGEIPVLVSLEVLGMTTNASCGTMYETNLQLVNDGVISISSFEYQLTIEDHVYLGTWEGSSEPGDQISVDVESFYPTLSPVLSVDISVLSINGESENIGATGLESVEIEAQELTGLVIIGDSQDAQFNEPQDLIDFITSIGVCGDVQAYLEPGTYNQLVIDQLELNGFELELTSLLQDNSSVTIEGESGMSSSSSDGITLRHLAFQTSIEAASISNSNSPTSFENCVFSGTSPGSLFIDTSDGCILQNCVFEGLVLVDASANCIIDGCEFYSNLSISDARNIRVLNNNLSSETSSNDQLGIVVMAGDLGQALFANNLVSSSIASPMYISNCDCDPNENIEVFNNIFTSESDLTSILLNNATRVQLIYNTVRADAGIALSVLGSSDIQVINNVLESETSNAAEFSDSSLQIVVRNNIFHSETSTGVQGYDSVEDFNSDPEQVAFDNIGIDPMLDDAGHFITNQEALGFALALTDLTTDFYGDLRDSVTPTCGAIETSFTGDTPGDFNGDGIVGAADLLVLLSNIGCTGDCGLADLDGDGVVGIGDLLILLGLI